MRLGSIGACVWIKGTVAELGHVYRFADQHCAKTAHSRDRHSHSARLAPKLKGAQSWRVRWVLLSQVVTLHLMEGSAHLDAHS
jgi:hypothetical protein